MVTDAVRIMRTKYVYHKYEMVVILISAKYEIYSFLTLLS